MFAACLCSIIKAKLQRVSCEFKNLHALLQRTKRDECKFQNNCYEVGSVYPVGCSVYTCIKKKVNGEFVAHIQHTSGGCLVNKKCYRPEAIFEDYCATLFCLPEFGETKEPVYRTVVLGYKCKDHEGKCVNKKKKFTYKHEGKTYTDCKCTVWHHAPYNKYLHRIECAQKSFPTEYFPID
ncbi:hypothetical protein PoB_000522700 [Plakobranchus ocellatus]|uniref:Uncharacterized protein n=1 Tax=Plakobranchus ocellatus TaxID=259542 RepID=A0AAV3Y7F4_9GAST|nr:hypothetical protein PoB_000522700 [Plakobranchus ocellatus]